MSITPEQWKALTESKYWRPEVGQEYVVIMSGWTFDMRTFKQDHEAAQEPRPTFVASVLSINDSRTAPREFSSSNKALNKMLMAAVLKAEKEGRAYLKLHMQRLDARTYAVVDLVTVEQATGVPYAGGR